MVLLHLPLYREDDIGTQIQDRFGKVVNDLGNSADMVKVYNRLMSVDAITRLAFIYGVGVRYTFCLFLNMTNNHTHRSGLEIGPIPGNLCFLVLPEYRVFSLSFHTKMFSFCVVWQKNSIEDNILVEEN